MTMSSVRSTDAQVGTLDLCEWVLEYIKFTVAKGTMGSSKILNMGYIWYILNMGEPGKGKKVF